MDYWKWIYPWVDIYFISNWLDIHGWIFILYPLVGYPWVDICFISNWLDIHGWIFILYPTGWISMGGYLFHIQLGGYPWVDIYCISNWLDIHGWIFILYPMVDIYEISYLNLSTRFRRICILDISTQEIYPYLTKWISTWGGYPPSG